MRRTLGFFCAMVALGLGPLPQAFGLADNAPTITMAFGFSPESEPLYAYFRDLYTEAFRRLGYRFAWQVYPLARCSVLADQGLVDGEPQRIEDYANLHPRLLRVPTVSFRAAVQVYTVDSSLQVHQWQDLASTSGTLVYLNGAVATQKNLLALFPADRLQSVSMVEQGLDMVRFGRATALVDLESRVRPLLATEPFRRSGLITAGTVDLSLGYPYLHERWAALVPLLARVLSDLQAEGLSDRYLRKALPSLFEK